LTSLHSHYQLEGSRPACDTHVMDFLPVNGRAAAAIPRRMQIYR
jgi:hypothetical protein